MDPQAVELVRTSGRWAVVGLSTNRSRAAYGVAAYLRRVGHDVVPVHPRAETVHDVPGRASLTEVPGPIDVVDVFVNSARAGAVVDEAVRVGARAVWLQPGVRDADAEHRARQAGLVVVTGLCPTVVGAWAGLHG